MSILYASTIRESESRLNHPDVVLDTMLYAINPSGKIIATSPVIALAYGQNTLGDIIGPGVSLGGKLYFGSSGAGTSTGDPLNTAIPSVYEVSSDLSAPKVIYESPYSCFNLVAHNGNLVVIEPTPPPPGSSYNTRFDIISTGGQPLDSFEVPNFYAGQFVDIRGDIIYGSEYSTISTFNIATREIGPSFTVPSPDYYQVDQIVVFPDGETWALVMIGDGPQGPGGAISRINAITGATIGVYVIPGTLPGNPDPNLGPLAVSADRKTAYFGADLQGTAGYPASETTGVGTIWQMDIATQAITPFVVLPNPALQKFQSFTFPHAPNVIRQYPRDDNFAIGAVRQGAGAGRSTSTQSSSRQGFAGTYS